MNNIVGAALAIGFVVLAGALYFKDAPQVTVNSESLGAAGTYDNIVTPVKVYSGFTEGGQFKIATTASAMTLRDGDLARNKVIYLTAMGAGQAALALSLPATTTWPSLDKPGVVQSWIIDATDVGTAATTTTITAGAGVDIDGITANDDVINGGVAGELRCWRLDSTEEGGNIRCSVRELVDAG